jgi:hypothetical protein
LRKTSGVATVEEDRPRWSLLAAGLYYYFLFVFFFGMAGLYSVLQYSRGWPSIKKQRWFDLQRAEE